MTKHEFLDERRFARELLYAALNGLDERTLTTTPVCGTWTTKDVLAHLAAWESDVLLDLQRIRRGETPPSSRASGFRRLERDRERPSRGLAAERGNVRAPSDATGDHRRAGDPAGRSRILPTRFLGRG